MKKNACVFIALTALLAAGSGWLAAAESGPPGPGEQEMFERAKVLIFDKDWPAALKQLDLLGQRFPQGKTRAAALFYRGKCLAETGRLSAALAAYEGFLQINDNKSLAEEAQISLIDLEFSLLQKDEKDVDKKILPFLAHPDKVIRYYAAFKLSYLSNKRLAKKALPVLKKIAATESDPELKDRARIAILRIDPAEARGIDSSVSPPAGRLLHIEVKEKGKSEPSLKLALPLALADLALRALPEKEKRELKDEGYDVEKLIRMLTSQKGTIIQLEAEGETIKIWIE